jgi:vacuolar iron transporter family protein
MKFGAMLQQLHRSFQNSAGTVVFGMEDGTVSIFGLIFGVAATTSNPKTVLIAGASGAGGRSRLDDGGFLSRHRDDTG